MRSVQGVQINTIGYPAGTQTRPPLMPAMNTEEMACQRRMFGRQDPRMPCLWHE